MSKQLSKERIQEIAKGYFPTSHETMVANTEQSLTYEEVNARYLRYHDSTSDYINDFAEELNYNNNGECDKVKEIIHEYCNVALRIALAWYGSSDELQNFYVVGDGIIGYIEDYIMINNLSEYYNKFEIINTVLSIIYDLDK
jgi:hypothetical protein